MINTRTVLALLTVAFVAPSQLRASVSPEDYDVPVSTAQQLRLGGTYSYAGSGSDTGTSDGSASLLYHRYYNSLPYAWDLNFNGVGLTRRTADGTQEGSYNFVAGSGIRKYFKPEGDLFYSGELRVTDNSDFDRPTIDVTPGVGYGRFIRVTPLAQAVRIEQFLLSEGLIEGPLPKKTLVALAQVIERRDEFETEFGDRYKVKWFEAMEQVIAESGLFVHGGFGAVGSLRVDEVLFQEHVNERFIGWDVRSGIRLEALTKDSDTPRQDPGLSLRVRYSRPVGWKSQFDFGAQYSSPFTGDFGTKVFTLSSSLNYLYEVTNRIDFTLSNILTASRSEPDVEATVVNQVRSGFIFFIENQVNLNVTGSIAKERGKDPTQGLNMAIEYRLR